MTVTRWSPLEVRERQATLLLGAYAVTLFVFPSDLVLRIVGGQGYVAGLIALALFLLWVASTLMGAHDPLQVRHPTRGAIAYFTLTGLVCWSLTPFRGLDGTQQLAADRWIMMLAGTAGVVLVAAEGLGRLADLLTVLRMTVYGAAFCGFVALLQWILTIDLSGLIRSSLPGFTVDGSLSVWQARGALQRVFGTAMHPIELGVVAGMMLPLAIVLAVHDRPRSGLARWLPVLLIGLAIPASVSRSAVLAALVSSVVLVLGLPARARVTALVLLPASAFAIGIARPGYLRTLAEFIGAGSADTSVSSRLDDYPRVARLVAEHPWFGSGGGTYLPADLLAVLDNQFLKSAIELGLIGITGLLVYLVVPVLTALGARLRSEDPVLRALAGALAGAALAGAVCAATFDAFSFNMFVGLQALVTGCAGACWVLSRREPHGHSPAVHEAIGD
ncbi:O-antigen ligase family protein [Geodermatophilus sp. SYSU D01180]